MSTQTIETFWRRWASYLRSEGWRDQVVDRLRRRIRINGRSQATSANVEPITVRLARTELVCLQEGSGQRSVSVRQGVVWLTGTPACGDVILHCGDSFEFGDQWPFVLQALENAEIELSA